MNIIFITTNSINSMDDGSIYSDLVKVLHKNGHNIQVFSALEKRDYIKQQNENIHRVKIGNITRVNPIKKAISLFTLNNKFMREIKKKNLKKVDLVIYNTPPITLNRTIKYLKKRYNSKTFLLLKDIFPQNAVDLGMFKKNGIIYQYYRGKEKVLYDISNYIGCMSEGNKNYILNNNELNSDKVFVVPNSMEIKQENDFNSNINTNDIRLKYNIPLNKKVFLYGGNIGKPQGVDFINKVIKLNEQNQSNYILIVGRGTEYKNIENFIENNNIKNSNIISYIPKEDYNSLVESSDVGLIFLDNRFTIPNIPSRLLSYLNAKKPVLAATDSNTDLKDIIKEGKFGYWCESTNENKFIELMSNFSDEEYNEKMGNNGYNYLISNYDIEDTYIKIMNIIGEKENV